jgi:hypothetical protein
VPCVSYVPSLARLFNGKKKSPAISGGGFLFFSEADQKIATDFD